MGDGCFNVGFRSICFGYDCNLQAIYINAISSPNAVARLLSCQHFLLLGFGGITVSCCHGAVALN